MKAGLVEKIEDWEFSSFRDYAGLCDGTIINNELAKEICGYDERTVWQESYRIIDLTS